MAFNVVERIADELSKMFQDIPIYREQQRGGFQEPSFFIEKITNRIKPNLFGIQTRDNHYQLVYFPNPDSPSEDMGSMEELLANNFQQLSEFATLRDRSFDYGDGTLLMTFTVSYRAVPVDTTVKQQSMDYQGGLKSD